MWYPARVGGLWIRPYRTGWSDRAADVTRAVARRVLAAVWGFACEVSHALAAGLAWARLSGLAAMQVCAAGALNAVVRFRLALR